MNEETRPTEGYFRCTEAEARAIYEFFDSQEFAVARSERWSELDRAAKRVVQPLVDSAAGTLDEGKECT